MYWIVHEPNGLIYYVYGQGLGHLWGMLYISSDTMWTELGGILCVGSWPGIFGSSDIQMHGILVATHSWSKKKKNIILKSVLRIEWGDTLVIDCSKSSHLVVHEFLMHKLSKIDTAGRIYYSIRALDEASRRCTDDSGRQRNCSI